jgi:hypothetical protein
MVSFIVFPKKTMRVLGKDEKNFNDLNIWRFIASGLIVGIPTTWSLKVQVFIWHTPV